MGTYNRLAEHDLRTWANSFASVAAANAAELGLQAADVAAIEAASEELGDSLDAQALAHEAAKGATIRKKQSREAMLQIIRRWANQWQANPTINNSLKTELGLPIHDTTPTARPVFSPQGLYVVGFSSGTNKLKWRRNGNFDFTVFVIEVKYDSPAGDWRYAGATTRTTFEHDDQTPGRYAEYRVFAERTGQRSGPSNTGIVYGNQVAAERAAA